MKYDLKDMTVDELRKLHMEWLEVGCTQYPAIRAAVIAEGTKIDIRSRPYTLYETTIRETSMPISALAGRETVRFVPSAGRYIGKESLLVTGGKYLFADDRYREHLLCRLCFTYSVNEQGEDFRYENIFNTSELIPLMEMDPIFIPGDWSADLYKRGGHILITNLQQNSQEAQDERERLSLLNNLLSGIQL